MKIIVNGFKANHLCRLNRLEKDDGSARFLQPKIRSIMDVAAETDGIVLRMPFRFVLIPP